MISFNHFHSSGKEYFFIQQAVQSGKIAGDGLFTKRCSTFFEEKYGFKKTLLTTSCTDALELAALLIGIEPGDEVIIPSYTFVSTANAFLLRGARIIFADSFGTHPCIDTQALEALITPKTKAIVPVHYAGVACDMASIMSLANKYGLYVVEDAAQAIDSYYTFPDGTRKALGSIGHLGAFSFHETKNLTCGEGGMLTINDHQFLQRAEIIREKGTNRSAFFRGEVDKYGWVDIGSSFLMSDLLAAFLCAQIEDLDIIQEKRKAFWEHYAHSFSKLNTDLFSLPYIPSYATNNAHMFYLVFNEEAARTKMIAHCRNNSIQTAFHYQSLHNSQYFLPRHDGRQLPYGDHYSSCLLRLPMHVGLKHSDIETICQTIGQLVKRGVSRETQEIASVEKRWQAK